ncbi:Uncharacterised protein [Mycobacteroides abscessus subsp. abscessus]|nr:Uncharacterised protein [Mycobacteroides abscessus subsp. abscessus]
MDAAVLVPAAQWQRMQSSSRATLKDLLLCDEARTDSLAPERTPARGNARRRPVVALD